MNKLIFSGIIVYRDLNDRVYVYPYGGGYSSMKEDVQVNVLSSDLMRPIVEFLVDVGEGQEIDLLPYEDNDDRFLALCIIISNSLFLDSMVKMLHKAMGVNVIYSDEKTGLFLEYYG